MVRSKKYRAVAEKVDANKLYTIEEACALVKETSTVKFDATIDVSFRLNVDPKQADQQVRGTLILPNGNGKTKRVLAITDKVDDALAAGADFAGGNEMLDKIQKENWFDFDVIVATPNMMGNIGKLGRVLGPKGLMPNPKTGTVSPDIAKAIKEIKAGKVEYRVDKEAKTFFVLPLPFGRMRVPLTCWSACFGSTLSLKLTSTVASNFTVEVSLTNAQASSIV